MMGIVQGEIGEIMEGVKMKTGRENIREKEEEYDFMMGRNRHRGDRRERNYRRFDHRDGSLNNIKMKIPSFQGRNDPEIYLEWEKKMEFIFDCHNYSVAIIQQSIWTLLSL